VSKLSTTFLSALLLVGALLAPLPAQRPAPFPEGEAAIEHLLLHYAKPSEDGWLPVYAGLVNALPADVRVTVAVGDEEEREQLVALLRQFHLRMPELLCVDVPITPWARDRMLALSGASSATILTPRGEHVADGYAGDLAVAHGLAEKLLRVSATMQLEFEGGDVLCSSERVFVGHATIVNNTARLEERAVVRMFAQMLQSAIVVVGRQGTPHEHADMYLTVLDDKTVALGCPASGAALLRQNSGPLPAFDTWDEQGQADFERTYEGVRLELLRQGLRVVRVPIVHGIEGGVLTWNNCLVERRAGVRRVYMPSYGAPALDEAAAAAFQANGCEVIPIDVAEIAADGGTVRCLTNVVAWRRDAAPRARS